MSKIKDFNLQFLELVSESFELLKNMNEENCLEYFKYFIQNESDLLKYINFKKIFSIGYSRLCELIDKSDKIDNNEKNQIKLKKLDEIIHIKDIPNDVISLCLNIQGCLLLEIDNKLNEKFAFEKFYQALELTPNNETCITNIEVTFPYSEGPETVEP